MQAHGKLRNVAKLNIIPYVHDAHVTQTAERA